MTEMTLAIDPVQPTTIDSPRRLLIVNLDTVLYADGTWNQFALLRIMEWSGMRQDTDGQWTMPHVVFVSQTRTYEQVLGLHSGINGAFDLFVERSGLPVDVEHFGPVGKIWHRLFVGTFGHNAPRATVRIWTKEFFDYFASLDNFAEYMRETNIQQTWLNIIGMEFGFNCCTGWYSEGRLTPKSIVQRFADGDTTIPFFAPTNTINTPEEVYVIEAADRIGELTVLAFAVPHQFEVI